MAARFVFYLAVQTIIVQMVFGQCLNRVVPSCGQNVVETVLPNQFLIREPGLIPGPIFQPQVVPAPVVPSPVVSELGYPQTIVQDGGVANSLANALQLLVVSSLLSNTLPGPCDPYPVDVMGYNVPYNYVY
ncbi:unnamed protein product [Danaus chrysippus]|uniref:(African queen) hypothetical protein n=1 Tax=Danaus chrysippus TaxID=151541 RepID=A0A8J2W6Z0_9NEOP|nr:unnamed protein product [Danaus chrysippus]